MVESKSGLSLRFEPPPVVRCCVEESVCSNKIGLDKRRRPVERSVDVAFCGKMRDDVGLKFVEHLPNGASLDDVPMYKREPIDRLDVRKRCAHSSIRKLVKDQHFMSGLTN